MFDRLSVQRLAAAAVLAAGLALVPRAGAVTLDACLAAALERNPDVRAATERVQAARAATVEAWSAWYPVLGGSAGYARTDNPPQAFMMSLNQRRASLQSDFNHPDDTDNLALSLGIQYTLYDFGRRGLDVRMARGQAEIAGLVLQGLQNELLHQVARGYYAVLQAAAFVNVQEESVQTLQESLRVAQERLQAGGVIKTDVLNLEVQLAQAGDELIRARNGVQLALAALNTAIGADLASAADMPVPAGAPGAQPPPGDELATVRARPEFLAAARAAEVRQDAHRKARRQYWPTLSAFGSADWNSELSTDFQDSYLVGLQAQVTFFDGFRRSAGARAAQAQARAARAEQDKAERQLRLDLATAILRAGEARERLDTARKSIESAEEALRITRERYQSGAADLPELLTAQVGLTGTRTRNVSALYDYLAALSNLERARGDLVRRHAPAPERGAEPHER